MFFWAYCWMKYFNFVKNNLFKVFMKYELEKLQYEIAIVVCVLSHCLSIKWDR